MRYLNVQLIFCLRSKFQTWSQVRHPNIISRFKIYNRHLLYVESYFVVFLGANVLDDQPFIVMPYFKNGNVRDYLVKHPDSDRLQIVCIPVTPLVLARLTPHPQLHGISMGLVYLHSHHIVHGDLKAVSYLHNLHGISVVYCGSQCYSGMY